MSQRSRILVIDDDPLFRSLILSLLRKDYIVSVASNGSDGFYKALEHPPHLAIIDIQMPGWDGLQTLKSFRQHPALADIKIAMMTSDATKPTVLSAIQGGANDYIIKTSFSKDIFLEKIEKLIEQVYLQTFTEELRLVATSASRESRSVVSDSALRDNDQEMAAALADNWE